jgi:hypothetical protein
MYEDEMQKCSSGQLCYGNRRREQFRIGVRWGVILMRLEHKRHAFGGEGGFLRAVPQNSSDDSRQVMNQEDGYRSWRIDKYHVLRGFESEGARYCALLPLQS